MALQKTSLALGYDVARVRQRVLRRVIGERPMLFDVQTNAIGLGPRSDIPAIRLLLE